MKPNNAWGIFLKAPLTLWVAASLIFFLSRLLPATFAPKGMEEVDTNTFGGARAEAVEDAKQSFIRKQGLHLPLFYVSLTHQSLEDDLLQSVPEPDRYWLKKAAYWHGTSNAFTFYRQWESHVRTMPLKEKQKLLTTLSYWAKSPNQEQRTKALQEVNHAITNSGSTLNKSSLQSAWAILIQQQGPLGNFLPAFRWHGTSNQYHLWASQVLRGDLGFSTRDYQPVGQKIAMALPVTLFIGVGGFVLATALSFLLATVLSLSAKAMLKASLRKFLYLLDSFPAFLLALGLLALFLKWGGNWDPISAGQTPTIISFMENLFSSALGAALVCTLLLLVPYLTLQFHQSLEEEKNKLYFRTALAKGLSARQSLVRHLLPNAFPPMLTLMSEVFLALIAGILVVEITFSLPGLGNLLTQSILTADYPVVIGLILLLLVIRMVVVWLAEACIIFLDPRARQI
ncbi:ABC transporter permease subunit [Rufibacter sp. LB8]|uniref:ABC transporter permease subunit n=3 Tax=Rufibacter sp. LB8 TaxID=2777781 RepID=UPI00351C2400